MHRLFRSLLTPTNPIHRFGRLLRRADAANRDRRWPDAMTAYAQALRIDPLRHDLWVQYAHCLKESGRPDAAASAYARAAALAPLETDPLLHEGFLHKGANRDAEAVTAFRALLARDPSRDDVRAELRHLGTEPPPATAFGPTAPFLDADDLPPRGREGAILPAIPPPDTWERLARADHDPGASRVQTPVVFFHLHKTGGLTLDDILAAHVAPRRICPVKDDHLHLFSRDRLNGFDLLSGHFDVQALRLIDRPARTVSVFRDPTARLISFYRFHAGHDLGGRHGVNDFARLANALGPEAFFEHEAVRRAPEVFNHYLTVFSLTYHQVRAARAVSAGQVTPALVARALERVRGLDAIAILERFDEGLPMACAALGVPAPRAVRSRNRTDTLARRMKGRPPPRVEMTPRLKDALADLVRFDETIYVAARDEYARRLAEFRATTPQPVP